MEHPKAKGDRSTLAIMLALTEAGFSVYLPFGENTRCDLIIDDGDRPRRVQCKTGRLRTGAVRFNTCSNYAHHPNPKLLRRDYHGQVDDFAVYCPETERVYLVPIADLPVVTEGALRVRPARNGQRRRIRQAAEYEVDRVAIGLRREPGGPSGAGGSSA